MNTVKVLHGGVDDELDGLKRRSRDQIWFFSPLTQVFDASHVIRHCAAGCASFPQWSKGLAKPPRHGPFRLLFVLVLPTCWSQRALVNLCECSEKVPVNIFELW